MLMGSRVSSSVKKSVLGCCFVLGGCGEAEVRHPGEEGVNPLGTY